MQRADHQIITFIFGLVMLIVGGAIYGKICEKMFCPDDRQTPAVTMNDGVDYIPMKKWKNCLIQLLNIAGTGPVLWIVYAVIFAYFIFASILPIDKIIGKVYPILGGVLLISSIGITFGIFFKGYPLDEIWNIGINSVHPKGLNFIPIFFVTVACGIISGFHSTQSTLVSRTIESEKHGRGVFYNMMIAEGFIAMTWAAATMGVLNMGLADADTPATNVVGIVSESMLGKIGGTIAVIGIIILPITSGDTAFRSLRLIISEALHIGKDSKAKKAAVSAGVFTAAAALLVFARSDPDGFFCSMEILRMGKSGNNRIHAFHDNGFYDKVKKAVSHGTYSRNVLYVCSNKLYP